MKRKYLNRNCGGMVEKDEAKKTFKIIHYFHGNGNIQILGRLIGLEISLDNG